MRRGTVKVSDVTVTKPLLLAQTLIQNTHVDIYSGEGGRAGM